MLSHRKRKPIAPRTGSWVAEPEQSFAPAYSARAQQPIILEGDLVRHSVLDYLNAGLPLQVLDTTRTEALCSYTEGTAPMLAWYPIAQLVLVHSAREADGSAE